MPPRAGRYPGRYLLPATLGCLVGGGSASALAAPTLRAGANVAFVPGYKVPLGLGLDVGFGSHGMDGAQPFLMHQVSFDLLGLSATRWTFGFRGGTGLDTEHYLVTKAYAEAGIAVRNRGGTALHLELGALRMDMDELSYGGFNVDPEIGLGGDVPFKPQRRDELPAWGPDGLQNLSLSVGTTARFMASPLGASSDKAGRPIRERGRPKLPTVLVSGPLSAESRTWLQRGRTEHASVPAFLQLAQELQAVGAPRRLVGRALCAAADERRHALLCYGMAMRGGGARVAVVPMTWPRARAGTRAQRLARLAAESLWDGILGEGDAARRAAGRRDATRDDLVARAEHIIVVEERGHAELAEDVFVWARKEGARQPGRSRQDHRATSA